MKTVILLTVLLCSLVTAKSPGPLKQDRDKPEAFVTLLFGSGFELGVRVLGQSIRESKTSLEYVVMCTHDVPRETRAVLKRDGWTVKMIDPIDIGDAQFDRTINKMQMYRLTEYRRIIWLDADVVLVKNIDHLVRCGKFCATFRHSDQFNSGVMVIKPSEEELGRIMKMKDHFLELPGTGPAAIPSSRTVWGDQNLLNDYYDEVYNLKATQLFDENSTAYLEDPMRLPEGYNTDLGLYIRDGQWTVDEKDKYIIHYTAGPLKPHSWWTYPFLYSNWPWYQLRKNLPSRFNDPSLWELFNWIPLGVVVTLIVCLRFIPFVSQMASSPYCRKAVYYIAPEQDGWIMALFPTTVLAISYYWSFQQVTMLLWPVEAYFVYGMWVAMFLTLFYVPPCYVFYMSTAKSSRVNMRCIVETATYVSAFVLMHLFVLWIIYSMSPPFVQRVLVFFSLVGLIAVYSHFAGKRILRIWCHSIKSTS